jgi:DNA polymerase-3 subunit gamma/tau
MAPNEVINQLLEAVEDRNISTLVELLNSTFDSGISATVLVTQLTASICDKIAQKPQLLPLLDALIDVTKSSQPQLKLLSVLGSATFPKQPSKTIALSTPILEVSASIAELEKQATEEEPSEPSVLKAAITKSVTAGTFDWDKLIEYTHQNYIALFSVLTKCSYQLDDDSITIYTNSKFYKNKLDDKKYRPLLSKCLQEIGVYGLDIHTIPTAPPPKDSQAAAIAAIMGGGEEVSLESE